VMYSTAILSVYRSFGCVDL